MASYSSFGQETTSDEVAMVFADQIRGKNVLITGISPLSIGSSMAISVAAQSPAHLLLASRTPAKMATVVDSIAEMYPNVPVTAIQLDLSFQKRVREAASQVSATIDKLHVLINNAGVMVPDYRLTPEDIEWQFGTNHIGPFLFTSLLVPLLLKAAQTSPTGATRVINLTSQGHRLSPVRFHDYNFQGHSLPEDEQPFPGLPPIMLPKEGEHYSGLLSYGQSKSANILMAVGLNERGSQKGIKSFAVHPGSIWTDLSRNLDDEMHAIISKTGSFWKNQPQGAATALVAAFDPALNETSGVYLMDCQLAEAAPYAVDPEKSEKLWKLSEKLVNRKFDI